MTGDPAFSRFRQELNEWTRQRAQALVDAFLATGRPQHEFSIWLREQRDTQTEET